jgi:hypothetical protein
MSLPGALGNFDSLPRRYMRSVTILVARSVSLIEIPEVSHAPSGLLLILDMLAAATHATPLKVGVFDVP